MPEFDSTSAQVVEYRPIADFPGYRVGSDGSVWSCWKKVSPNASGRCDGAKYMMTNEWRSLSLSLNRTGYPRAALYKDGKQRKAMVHILVLNAFVGPRPPGMQALHKKDNKSDSRLESLRWGTPVENWEDRKKNGKCNPAAGETHGMARLGESDVLVILGMDRKGVPSSAIATQFGLSHVHVRRIVTGKSWKHLKAGTDAQK